MRIVTWAQYWLSLAVILGVLLLCAACEREHSNPLDPESQAYQDRPLAPAGLTAVGEPSRIRLEWEASAEPDVVGYAVYRASRPDGDYIMLTGLTGETVFYDDDGALEVGNTYYYRVACVQRTGVVGDQSPYVYAQVH